MDFKGRVVLFFEMFKMIIWKIYKDSKLNIWLCIRDCGLILFDRFLGILKEINVENSVLIFNNIRIIEEGENDEIWIGSEDYGFFLWDVFIEKIERINEILDKIKFLFYEIENFWVGINGSGLKEYNIKSKIVKVYIIE